jgi:hypothetical protein
MYVADKHISILIFQSLKVKPLFYMKLLFLSFESYGLLSCILTLLQIYILKPKYFPGCPSGCKCSVIDNKENNKMDDRLVVQGQHLHGIPEKLPTETVAL